MSTRIGSNLEGAGLWVRRQSHAHQADFTGLQRGTPNFLLLESIEFDEVTTIQDGPYRLMRICRI